LFVPNNPNYEGSDLLWFDEHNHPADGQQIDRTDPRYQLRRCYKLVSLVHLNRQLDFFVVVGARVICGRRHGQAQNKTLSGYTKERKTNQFAYFCSA